MYKESKDKLKKSTLVISTIAILLMVTITTTPTMNSSAFDLGLISKDNNVGSIDTSSLFNCFGAAITCDNDNTVNNNIAINNGTNGGDTPLLACDECFTNNLTPEEISALEGFLQFSIAEICETLSTSSPENIPAQLDSLEDAMVITAGVDPAIAQAVIDCLEAVFGV
ncbi:hypothetical protein [Candidatus Nitrosocosmicus hydrocola]|uniref:hypothetical protein n=1 Tax=Candidatus Nitrosocosmicus hydrocola TaxID=1826872 RepID=UPI0011E5A123|nr:hypothetical protein [Candidatus Nitrosocosmicus hydrocola]